MEDISKISTDRALEHFYQLRLYEEQQAQGHELFLRTLPHYEEALLLRKKQNQR